MSSPLAVAGVTAALKDLLNDGLLNHDLSPIGSFTVTAQPPDRVVTGATEPNQLNLFLYQVTANAGRRNEGLPTTGADGRRLGSAPLALDLHYLLTAYGAKDMNAEVLLGYAMQVLHDTPVLTRDALRKSLGSPSPVDGSMLPSPFGTLSAADLADQTEMIKITPVFLTTEDLSKLWTAMQARYRLTVAYTVSVVLIQSQDTRAVAEPVLKQGPDDRGPVASGSAPPALTSVRPVPPELPGARLGDELRLTGANLAGISEARLRHLDTGVERRVPVVAESPQALRLHLPSDGPAMHEWSPGLYTVSLIVAGPLEYSVGGAMTALAPLITVSPSSAAAGDITLTVECRPRLTAEQEPHARLRFGAEVVEPDTVVTPADDTQPTTLTFKLTGVQAGSYRVRLRVKDVESLPVTLSGSGLAFDPTQTVVVT
jgi:hypothetical protein